MAGFREIVSSDKPVLIDFYADWCGPCKTLAPMIKQVKDTVGSKAQVLKIDLDRNQELANALNIQGVPTLMIWQKGELKWRQSGVVPTQMMLNELAKYTG